MTRDNIGEKHYIPKSLISAAQKERYDRAFARRREKEPFLTRAEWIRQGLDAQASRDLGPSIPGNRRVI